MLNSIHVKKLVYMHLCCYYLVKHSHPTEKIYIPIGVQECSSFPTAVHVSPQESSISCTGKCKGFTLLKYQ